MLTALVVSLALLDSGSSGFHQELASPVPPATIGAATIGLGVGGLLLGGGGGLIASAISGDSSGSPILLGAVLGGLTGVGLGFLADSGHGTAAAVLSCLAIGVGGTVLMVMLIEQMVNVVAPAVGDAVFRATVGKLTF